MSTNVIKSVNVFREHEPIGLSQSATFVEIISTLLSDFCSEVSRKSSLSNTRTTTGEDDEVIISDRHGSAHWPAWQIDPRWRIGSR